MNRREAKRAICRAAVLILDSGDNEYLHFADYKELPQADLERLQAAHAELLEELERRGGSDDTGRKCPLG